MLGCWSSGTERGDPEVLAAEAVGQHGGGGLAGEADEAAGQDAVAVRPGHDVGAQRVGGRHQPVAVECRCRGQLDRLDGHPAMRRRGQPCLERRAARHRERAGEHARGLARIVALGGLQECPALRLRQGRRARLRIAQPQRAHVRQQGVLAQDAAEQRGRERRQRMVLHHAAAEPVHHDHVAAACRFDQPGDAGQSAARQTQRVHAMAGLLADDEVDPLQAVQRLQVEMVVADGEVAALRPRCSRDSAPDRSG